MYWACAFCNRQEGEKLYCLSYRYDQADGGQVYSLSTFDLASGEMLSLEEDTPLRLMTPYNDGQMLAVVLPGGETFDADSGEPALVDLANRLYPSYRDVCFRDGKLYLLPVSAYPQSLGYCIEALEALGLTEDDLPKTYPELFDFCAQFSDRFGAEHPEVSLAADLGLRDLLLGLITDQYVAYQMKTTGSITLDTPLLRKLMSGLEALDFSEWDPSETYGDDVWSHSDVVDEFYGSNRLGLFVSCSVSPSEYASRNAYSRPLLLSLDDGLEPILPAISARVFFVNPRSARMEQAVQYLTVYLQNLPWETKVAFFEDADDPVPNPYYESSVARVQAYVDDLEKQLAAAAPENRAELEDAIQTMQDNLQEMEKDRYDLSREDIARYRQNAAPYIYVLPQTPLTDGDTASNFSQLMQQYRQHAIDLDTYLQEAQRRLRLMQMEGQ